MGGLQKYLQQVMQDNNGTYSSKRAVTFICVIMMAVGYFANLFAGFKVEQYMYDSVMYIVIAGLGFSGAEKFAQPKKAE